MPAQTNCRWCGSTFTLRRPSERRESGNFCSRSCYAAHQRTLTGEKANRWQGEHITLTCDQCGEPFEIIPSKLKNQSTGVTRRFCSRACWDKARKNGKDAPKWRGGRYIDSQGYVSVFAPDHPRAVNNRVHEHRLVMERQLGRPLQRDEHVHHIDGNRSNNDVSNLVVLSASEHMKLHRQLEAAAIRQELQDLERES